MTVKELRLWYYLRCPEKIDLAPSQANTLLSDLDQLTGYGSTFEGCELCRV